MSPASLLENVCESVASSSRLRGILCNQVVCSLTDVKSTNGVFINNKLIQSGVAVRLVPDDVIGN